MKKLLLLVLLVVAVPFEGQLRSTITPGTHTVTLTWTWSQGTGPAITSFEVYKATAPGGYNWSSPLTSVASTVLTYTDTAFTQTSYYVVVAVVTQTAKSVPSNEVTNVFPPVPTSPSLSSTIARLMGTPAPCIWCREDSVVLEW